MLVRVANGAQADFSAGPGRHHYIKGTHLGHLFKEFSWGATQTATLHPLLQGAPHDQRKEAHEDVRPGAPGFLMIDGAVGDMRLRVMWSLRGARTPWG